MALKKGDFIEINYTGRLDEEGKTVFDTTDENIAKQEQIYSPKTSYGSSIVALGENHILPGLDKALIGKEIGKHTIKVADVDGFGKKSAKLMKLVPAKIFKRDNLRPMPGLQVNIDGEIGIIRSVSGGRIIVDFNHPLASKNLEYDVEVIRVVEDDKEKVNAFFNLIGLPTEGIDVKGDAATITTKTLFPQQLTDPLVTDIKRLTGLKTVSFQAANNETEGNDTKEKPASKAESKKDA